MSNRRSTVEFTDVTEPLLAKLDACGFDVRAIVNGGIVAFNKLTGDQQKTAISEANGVEIADPSETAAESARYCIKTMQSLSEKDRAIAFQFLSVEESRAIKEMLDALNPEIQTARRKRRAHGKTA